MTATDQTAAALLWGVATAVAMVVLVPAAAWLTARVGARAQGRRPRRRPGPFGVLVPLARAAALLTAGEDPRPPRDGLLRAWVPVAVLLAAALGFGVAALAPASGQGMAAAEPALGLLLLAAAGVYLGHAAALAAPAAAGVRLPTGGWNNDWRTSHS